MNVSIIFINNLLLIKDKSNNVTFIKMILNEDQSKF